MKQEYLKYGKRLNDIGDMIISATATIKTPDSVSLLTPEGSALYKNELTVTVENVKYTKDVLEETKRPHIIQREHKKLVEGLNQFIESIATMRDSFKIVKANEGEFDRDQYDIGMNLQKEAVIEIGKASELIGDILVSYLQKN
ncbi:hypothetical protein COK01_26350 [Priestia megaterium]|uniref:hypothetical protein n=1 Tax=Priestia megaterium TaxID=1404 RepID=UPI000BF2DC0F|nr:hypothetical protein [Priestia megaterium]PFP44839.1 hypothetical protein COK01_26350 [Priestia megaterium]